MANSSMIEDLKASGLDHKTAEAISDVIVRDVEDAMRSSGSAAQSRSQEAAQPAASPGSISWLVVGTFFALVGLMMIFAIWQSDTVRRDMRAAVGSVRAEVGSVRNGFRAETGSVRSDMRAEFGRVRAEMGSIRAEMGRMQEKIGNRQDEIESMRTELDEIRSAISSLGEQMIHLEMLIQDRLPSAP